MIPGEYVFTYSDSNCHDTMCVGSRVVAATLHFALSSLNAGGRKQYEDTDLPGLVQFEDDKPVAVLTCDANGAKWCFVPVTSSRKTHWRLAGSSTVSIREGIAFGIDGKWNMEFIVVCCRIPHLNMLEPLTFVIDYSIENLE